jgi:hypothetical protein
MALRQNVATTWLYNKWVFSPVLRPWRAAV